MDKGHSAPTDLFNLIGDTAFYNPLDWESRKFKMSEVEIFLVDQHLITTGDGKKQPDYISKVNIWKVTKS